MKYYELLNDYRKEVIGNVDIVQSTEMVCNGSEIAHESLRSFFRVEPFERPVVAPFLLLKNAKLTDSISSMRLNNKGFILHNKLIDFLKGFRLKEFYKIPVELTYKRNCSNIIDNYSLFIISESIFPYIDIANSSFFVTSIIEKYHKKIYLKSISSIDDFHSRKKQWHYMIKYDKLVLKKGFDFDMFRIGHKMGGYYVSERLKDAIEKGGFTGLIFEEADNIVI